ncbi:MAG: hypothetical protein EOP09_03055 [Proteobacteria bacterium]|nr:MAG: hypothetical protein EOP09_03055 [Pseudomonadota bacterium]
MSSSTTKAADYKRVVEQAEIVFIGAVGSRFHVEEDYDEEHQESEKFIDQTLVRDGGYDPETNLLEGFVQCRVWMTKAGAKKAKTPDEAFDNALFACEIVYRAVFQISGEHEEATLGQFFERTAPFATWAYFRSHVAQMASAACIKVPILPIKKQFYPLESSGAYRTTSPETRKMAGGSK